MEFLEEINCTYSKTLVPEPPENMKATLDKGRDSLRYQVKGRRVRGMQGKEGARSRETVTKWGAKPAGK